MRPTENKELTPKESDTSALLEISVLLKILSSTNSATLKRHQLAELTRTHLASSTTKDPTHSVTSVLKVSTLAPKVAPSVLVPQEPTKDDLLDTPNFIASLLYLLINFPRNYSLVHF